jgi:hypothetical protein
MDGLRRWVGARFSWRVNVADDADVVFDGQISAADVFDDGTIRVSGALSSGARFVIVTDEGSALVADDASRRRRRLNQVPMRRSG